MEINKTYEPQKIEKKWYKYWLDNGLFTPEIDKNKKPYTILIPPPNVTGILHMGHVLNNTLQDVMIRYKRMTGIPTLWIPGVDHAGIATQNMVEKELAKEGKTRHDIGREELVERVWKWKEEKGGRIIEQLKQLGCSCDWTKQRFTMDEGLSDAVKEVFISLYKKGLIYKGKRIINWCPRCVTALANDEVDYEDDKGHMWHIKYPFVEPVFLSGVEGEQKIEYLTVATTRPETMLGDTAVAVHPDDKRYKQLVGKMVKLPLTDREIPVIADEYVDKDFGSGFVKITPAHDPNDYEVGIRHNLEQIIVMDEHGIMNEEAGKEFTGLNRFECRKKIVKMLKEQDLLEKIEDHDHSVGQCYRCDTVIEPYLSDQWFVKMKPLAAPAIEAVKDGRIKLQPERWTKVYYHWMENVRDWCISRQIWWGHRIPAYYCLSCGKMIVAKDMPDKCPDCGHEKFRQDEDVLDTWFSSWLWPFSTMGWPKHTEELDYFLPTNLLITAPGIIYLWVARMIMSTLEFQNKIPFDTVLLHGMVLDEQGRKMSKSLGNSPDPIHIIEEYGADALRFSIIFNTPKGQDSYYSESILETGRNFANKIWNAYRFMMMNVEKIDKIPESVILSGVEGLKLELADKWIYSRLNQVTKEITEQLENLRMNDAASLLMDFIWKEFCSWYLELSKDRIYNEQDKEGQLTAKYILLDVFQTSMRLLQPFMPFIAEEIWQGIREFFPLKSESIIVADFPKANQAMIDENIDKNMEFIQETITAIRNLRKQVNLAPGKEVGISIKVASEDQIKLLNDYQSYFAKLAKITDMDIAVDLSKPKSSIAAVVQNIEIYLPLEGLIDLDAERSKLEKQLEKLEKELKGISGKLKNKKFLENAPEKIVEKEKEKFTEIETKVIKTRELLDGLK
ncbi:MAG: valine--tRNA ligase [Candidatus Cloacimonetes bacterium]|nr:valine--tRNA ligase [Candidatus Cloacimonadota bacterium]MCF7814864.1 valine--tRNA ligase [Candidatus Cloacimonadota bacterium]MCF7867946.1 valine--tRNA ligase [Candidatus Cloacimonadota bacterium]MCF7883404.1 valine--tRNA ligase [Candidatus Cloacimonadota bacterium]